MNELSTRSQHGILNTLLMITLMSYRQLKPVGRLRLLTTPLSTWKIVVKFKDKYREWNTRNHGVKRKAKDEARQQGGSVAEYK